MNGLKLKAMRSLLNIDLALAAESLGDVSIEQWSEWESSANTVPDCISSKISKLIDYRHNQLCQLAGLADDGFLIEINYYSSLEQFITCTNNTSPVMWRVSQSISADLAASWDIAVVSSGGTCPLSSR